MTDHVAETSPQLAENANVALVRGRALRRAREDADLSPQELSCKARELAGGAISLNRDRIYDFEQGRALLERPIADYLAEALSVRVDDLLIPFETSFSSRDPQGFWDGVRCAETRIIARDAQSIVIQMKGVELELKLEVLRREKVRRFVGELRGVQDRIKHLARIIRLAGDLARPIEKLEDVLSAASRCVEETINSLEETQEDHALRDQFELARQELARHIALLESAADACRQAAEGLEMSYLPRFDAGDPRTPTTGGHIKTVIHTLEAINQLESATARFDSECKRESPPNWRQLSTLAWSICDLTQVIDFEIRRLFPEHIGPLSDAVQYMLLYVNQAKEVLQKTTSPDECPEDEDLFKLRIASSHVQTRIPSLRECIELQRDAQDGIERFRSRPR